MPVSYTHLSMLSEEMRILYVALTRAKEKLVITAVQNDLEKKLSGFAGALAENDRVSPYVARSAQSYADWMLMADVYKRQRFSAVFPYFIFSFQFYGVSTF